MIYVNLTSDKVMKKYTFTDDMDPMKYAKGDRKALSDLRKMFVGAVLVDMAPDPNNPTMGKFI